MLVEERKGGNVGRGWEGRVDAGGEGEEGMLVEGRKEEWMLVERERETKGG